MKNKLILTHAFFFCAFSDPFVQSVWHPQCQADCRLFSFHFAALLWLCPIRLFLSPAFPPIPIKFVSSILLVFVLFALLPPLVLLLILLEIWKASGTYYHPHKIKLDIYFYLIYFFYFCQYLFDIFLHLYLSLIFDII